ncbi:hypothetical protein [Cellulosimicrobium sp. Marseille-Q8652]
MDATRARKVKIGLAGLAVLGLGAALTSAQWTDQVFFQADVSTGTFNIQGGVPADQGAPTVPTTWVESDTWDGTEAGVATIELDLGSAQVAPDETTTLTGYVRNDPSSTWTADVSAITVTPFLPTGVTASVAYATGGNDPADLDPGDSVAFTVTVAASDAVVQDASGELAVTVDGVSVAPVTP